jgi:hypothetical protein
MTTLPPAGGRLLTRGRQAMNTLTRKGGLWIAVGTGIGIAVGVGLGMGSVGLAVGLAVGVVGGCLMRR